MAARKTTKKASVSKTSSKKSPVLLIALGILAVLLVALLFPKLQNTAKESGDSKVTNPITSIKEALSKSMSIECTYTDEEGRETVTYMKNGAIRSDMQGESAGSVIVKDTTMYSWDQSTKEGMKMVFADQENAGTSDDEESDVWNNPEDAAEQLEKYKESCKTAVVSDSLFTPPADVKFMDVSEMMADPQSLMQ